MKKKVEPKRPHELRDQIKKIEELKRDCIKVAGKLLKGEKSSIGRFAIVMTRDITNKELDIYIHALRWALGELTDIEGLENG